MIQFIDFEYNKANEAKRNLVSMSALSSEGTLKEFWLLNDDGMKNQLKVNLRLMRESAVFAAFNVEAEAGSFISLGLDPTKFKWIDLQKEWKMLINHCDKYGRGHQLIDGKVVYTHNPGIKRNLLPQQVANKSFAKAETSLAAALFKMCDVKIDKAHKDAMRDIILSCDDQKIAKNKAAIMQYCSEDVAHLPELWKKIKEAYKELKWPVKKEEVFLRGQTAADITMVECRGYPVSKTIRNFAWSTPKILKDCAEDINSQFPDLKIFVWNKARETYTMKRNVQKDWIKANVKDYLSRWDRTNTNQLSLKIDAWTKQFSYRSPYPRDVVPAQIIRYLRLKQSLNGFLPKAKNAKNKETFFSSMGSDYRVRPYLNPYGSQSGRYQPKATSYIPLKASWIRYFIQPRKGRAICGIDYKSQEFLIAALLGRDEKMVQAYKTGDVYVAFGKDANLLPSDADKSHPLRPVCKETVLAVQFLMGAESLARILTQASGRTYTADKADTFIHKFARTYPDNDRTRKHTIRNYRKEKFIKLPDGFIMGPDNSNHRSVANMPIQGRGSCVLRRWIRLCLQAGLKVILPLHDALYCEITKQSEIDLMKKLAVQAFCDIFPDNPDAKAIQLDVYAWGKDVDNVVTDPDIHTMRYYLEPRSMEEFDRFKKYFIGGKNETDRQ